MLKIQSPEEFWSIRTLLLIIYIVFLFASFFYFLLTSRRKEVLVAKRISLGYGLFGLCYGMTRLLFLLSDYEIAYHFGEVTRTHLSFVTAAYSVTFISIMFIYFTVEKYILSRKLIFTFLSVIAFSISVLSFVFTVGNLLPEISPQRIAQYTLYFVGPVLALGILSLYIIIYRSSPKGSLKNKSLMAIIGLVIFFSGLLLDMDVISTLLASNLRLLISPILFLVGTFIFFYSQK
ncbi:MAG: hypothetical protein ACTSWN_16395 [Promethearchaeota archaeon]